MSALSQCIGREAIKGAGLPGAFGRPWPYATVIPFDMPYEPAFPTIGSGLGPNAAYECIPAATCGGGLAVTSASPIAPTGLRVKSENTIEGVVAVSGQLPFLGAVAIDRIFPSIGAGTVSYGCGDGVVAIVAAAPIAAAAITSSYGYWGALSGGNPYNGFCRPVVCEIIYQSN